MHLTRLTGDFAVARAAPDAPLPDRVASLVTGGGAFVTVSRTAEELSVVAPEAAVAGMDRIEPGWSLFMVHGPFAFDETGIVAALSKALAEAGIGIFVISTFDTDWILVKTTDADRAAGCWRADGHRVD